MWTLASLVSRSLIPIFPSSSVLAHPRARYSIRGREVDVAPGEVSKTGGYVSPAAPARSLPIQVRKQCPPAKLPPPPTQLAPPPSGPKNVNGAFFFFLTGPASPSGSSSPAALFSGTTSELVLDGTGAGVDLVLARGKAGRVGVAEEEDMGGGRGGRRRAVVSWYGVPSSRGSKATMEQ